MSFGDFRKQLLAEQKTTQAGLNRVYLQLFLNNPVLIVENVKFYLPLFYRDHIQKIIFETKAFYEYETLSFLQLHYRTFGNVIDVGANIGNHTLFYCCKMQAKKVYSFEPNRFNMDILTENVRINYLENKVETFLVALGAAEGKAYQTNGTYENTGMNAVLLTGKSDEQNSIIPVKCLDSYGFEKIDFIKIDVEGFEASVLRGAAQTIRRWKPVILVEAFEVNRNEVESIMDSFGYKKFFTFKEYDMLFIPA